jgi:hypothetical protein
LFDAPKGAGLVDQMTIDAWLQAANLGALGLTLYLLARGYLVPMIVVQQFMLAPLNARIEALERVSARKDELNAELVRQQAAAIEAQGRALELIGRGGGQP